MNILFNPVCVTVTKNSDQLFQYIIEPFEKKLSLTFATCFTSLVGTIILLSEYHRQGREVSRC